MKPAIDLNLIKTFLTVLEEQGLKPAAYYARVCSPTHLDMATLACEPNHEEGHALWTEEVTWYGNAMEADGKIRAGVLSTNCILQDRDLEGLREANSGFNLVLEAATVASLRDAVEAGFCQAFLPASLEGQLKRSEAFSNSLPLRLTFSLVGNSVKPSFAKT